MPNPSGVSSLRTIKLMSCVVVYNMFVLLILDINRHIQSFKTYFCIYATAASFRTWTYIFVYSFSTVNVTRINLLIEVLFLLLNISNAWQYTLKRFLIGICVFQCIFRLRKLIYRYIYIYGLISNTSNEIFQYIEFLLTKTSEVPLINM